MADPPIRVASWPHWYAPNPYLPLFYEALARYGVRHVKNVPLDARSLLEHRPPIDVLHLHWPDPFWRDGSPAGPIRLLRVGRLLHAIRRIRNAGMRFVWTVHNLEHHEGAGPIDRLGYRFLHRMADLRIFHSRCAREEADARYRATGDALVMPMGNFTDAYAAPGDRAETVRRLGLPPHERLLLCFGQLRHYKGFDVAVDSMTSLDPEVYHLVIAGRPVGTGMADLARTWADRPNVTVLPRVVDDQLLADLLGAADTILLPYRQVTGSAALVTALSFGRGVVATRLPYFQETLEPETAAGVLVPPDDARALADGIGEFFAISPRKRSGAAQRLRDRYAWEDVVPPVARWLRSRAAGR